MSQTINPKAPAPKIKDHAQRAYWTASARGGRVAMFANTRLAPALAVVRTAADTFAAATAKADGTRAALAWQEKKVAHALITLRVRAWNVLGRPRRADEIEYVFPGGARTYANAPTEKKPRLLRLLAVRFRSVASERWTPAMREAWAAEVDALREALAAALAAYEPTETAEMLARGDHRGAIRYLHRQLCSFKRDMQSDGMSAAQINAIIPDGTAANGDRRKQARRERRAIATERNDSATDAS